MMKRLLTPLLALLIVGCNQHTYDIDVVCPKDASFTTNRKEDIWIFDCAKYTDEIETIFNVRCLTNTVQWIHDNAYCSTVDKKNVRIVDEEYTNKEAQKVMESL